MKKAVTVIAGWLIATLSIAILFQSCKNPKPKFVNENCVYTSEGKLDVKWQDEGFLNEIDSIIIMPVYDGRKLQATIEAHRSDGSLIEGSQFSLWVDPICTGSIPQGITVNKNMVKLSALQIVEGDHFIDFDFLTFQPTTYTQDGVNYLAFNINVEMEGRSSFRVRSDPCPPLCPIPLEDPTPPPKPQEQ